MVKLSDVQLLRKDYTNEDVTEMVAVINSVVDSTPLSQLQLGTSKPTDVHAWLMATYTRNLSDEFKLERIANASQDEAGWSIPRAEHLVMRDCDMQHVGSDEDSVKNGCIVAHADYRYYPSFNAMRDYSALLTGTVNQPIPYPVGYNVKLRTHFYDTLLTAVDSIFHGLPCFSLVGISTLTPSHLRKGIAKRLTEWVFGYSDEVQLPVILAASPLGLPLYLKCGFIAYRKFDIVIDRAEWGGEGKHQHVVMVRWPTMTNNMPVCWVEWRKKQGEQ